MEGAHALMSSDYLMTPYRLLVDGSASTLTIWRLVRLKGNDFAVHWAYKDHQETRRPPACSCFSGFTSNETIRRWHQLEQTVDANSPGRPNTWDGMWKNQRLQEIIHAIATKYSPGYVFRRDMNGRHQLQRGVFSLPRDHQRAIILWVLGRNIQPWEPCRYSGLASDSKKHLEQCRLPENPPSPLMAPSHIEHELSMTRRIRALAGQILGLVGRVPTEGLQYQGLSFLVLCPSRTLMLSTQTSPLSFSFFCIHLLSSPSKSVSHARLSSILVPGAMA